MGMGGVEKGMVIQSERGKMKGGVDSEGMDLELGDSLGEACGGDRLEAQTRQVALLHVEQVLRHEGWRDGA
jgi:hypothetical protein